jgi:4-carboxymuconolactone decarboxylase
MDNRDASYEIGMQMRRDMFGRAGAEDRVNAATDFNRPFEDTVTRYCFGEIWSRPGLDRRTRSMITLAALTALVRPNQLRNHVLGALANGVTRQEISEILMHTAVYAGIPAGVEAFAAAAEALKGAGV